jgi:excisionase family DNA binding protein
MVEYMTVREVANSLRVSPITVRRYIKSGRLRAVRVGHGVRISADSVEALAVPMSPDAAEKVFTLEDPIWAVIADIERETVDDGGPTDVSADKKKYLRQYKMAKTIAPSDS